MDINKILDFVIQIAVLLFAVSIHESAHGWMAEKFGDPTARMQGRITLNPIPHIDPVGSIIFPVILAILHAPVFGWAKPVIVNPYNLRNYRRATIFISAAGPGSNIITASVGVGLFLLLKHINFGLLANPGGWEVMGLILFNLIIINIFLAIFNLIPVRRLTPRRRPVQLPEAKTLRFYHLTPGYLHGGAGYHCQADIVTGNHYINERIIV
jgi:Zn-dependent protease